MGRTGTATSSATHSIRPTSRRTAKDRLTVIDVLTNHRPRRFVVNAEALSYIEASGLSAVRRRQLAQVPGDVIMDEALMQALLETHLPGLGPQQRKWILDATAVAAYHADVECARGASVGVR